MATYKLGFSIGTKITRIKSVLFYERMGEKIIHYKNSLILFNLYIVFKTRLARLSNFANVK